jgi:hypothetical protein
MDGTLTGLGPDTWAVKGYNHLKQKECTLNVDKFDGLICDSSIKVRRVSFYGATPKSLFDLARIVIYRWDDD